MDYRFVCLSVRRSVCLAVCLSVSASVCLLVFGAVWVSVCLSVCLFDRLSLWFILGASDASRAPFWGLFLGMSIGRVVGSV